MTLKLRPYQIAAVDALFTWWANGQGDALIVMPTGTGKALVLCDIMQRCMKWSAEYRPKILCLTHVQELVEQNHKELLRYWPSALAGINSSALNSRSFNTPMTFCSIQSVHRHAGRFGHVDIVIIDEAHLISRNGSSMYQKFLAHLRAGNPLLKVVGLTATPFRLDSGVLHEGDDKLFDGICHDYNIRDAFADGYLTRPISKATIMKMDTDGVATRGGEFISGELEAAVDKAEITKAAVDEMIKLGEKRQSWLVYCSGVDHSNHVATEIKSRGISCAVVTGETDNGTRRRTIADYKAGKIRCLCSMNVITTGFNDPKVDMLALLRPTKSAGLYVQIIGRGTRNVYAPGYDLETTQGRLDAILNGGKPNCLVLDFARNIERFGPIDQIEVKQPKKGTGEAPSKECPDCQSIIHAAARVCPDCGHVFPEPQTKMQKHASALAIVSDEIADAQPKAPNDGMRWETVRGIEHDLYLGPSGTTMVVKYNVDIKPYFEVKEWVAFEAQGQGRQKAVQWWYARGGGIPPPMKVSQALARTHELAHISQIGLRRDGKYWRVEGFRKAEATTQQQPGLLRPVQSPGQVLGLQPPAFRFGGS